MEVARIGLKIVIVIEMASIVVNKAFLTMITSEIHSANAAPSVDCQHCTEKGSRHTNQILHGLSCSMDTA